ncbi:MAG TPA: MFS transporter [Caldisericia bacterium]|nr:MFS transporter [Caldisericia bacterium]HPI83229.1 MFS transporter [Caldisericia bacterium]HPQ92456.1 MFS transporter [Caldisericia bacterium]HRV74446.1 MFS transporter [Caldisericia bacterium]
MNVDTKGNSVSWLPILMTLSAAMAIMAFQNVFSPVTEILKSSNNLSNWESMLVVSSPSLFLALLSFTSGKILDRINPIKTSLFCFIASAGISVVGLFVTGLWGILISRLIAGIAFAPLMVLALQLPQVIYPPHKRNRMTAIQTLGAPMGAIIALYAGAWIGTNLGYTYNYIIPIALCLIGIATSIPLLGMELDRNIQTGANLRLSSTTKMMAASWILFTGSTSIFLFLGTQIGISHELRLFIAVSGPAFLMIPPLLITPIIGEIIDKKASRLFLLVVSSLAMVVAFQLLWINKWSWAIGALLLGVFSAFIPPIVFSTPSRFEKPENTGSAIGLINTLGTTGMFIVPPLAALLMDTVNGWWIPMIISSSLSFGILVIAISQRRRLS